MALGIFMLAWFGGELFPEKIYTQYVWMRQLVFKTLLAGLTILVITLILRRNLSDFGFKKGKSYKKFKIMLPGLILGALATVLILISPAQGNPAIKNFNLLQLILFIWIYSSLTEEIFCRGFIQSYLTPLKDYRIEQYSLPVFISAVVFGLIHLSLIVLGADIYSIILTVGFTFVLGLYAGKFREIYDSLWPAFWVHMAFNIGGTVTGIIYGIFYVIITGSPPV